MGSPSTRQPRISSCPPSLSTDAPAFQMPQCPSPAPLPTHGWRTESQPTLLLAVHTVSYSMRAHPGSSWSRWVERRWNHRPMALYPRRRLTPGKEAHVPADHVKRCHC
ncbi:hypothetical protein BDV36DRAFT_104824 [Aspergillus pseudocaelatus]|uniref:Uncharacterized protein n=1 Tax=Aspergillus pseudocaelatus TaxID=1825620 RepID=A0ABQ6WTM1_9EURO|nr:hypothetical protein BDV36DRAFT_104824 [Aspergillus pseudocaelatus]